MSSYNTVSNKTTVWKALLKSFQQNGKHFSHAKNGSSETEYRYKSEFQRWKKHKSLKASYTFFCWVFLQAKWMIHKVQKTEHLVTSNLEEVGLFSWLVSVFLWQYSRRLVQTIVPDLHCAPFWISMSFPHHQLNVKYGTILQNCSEMQFRKCRNMEKMQKKAHDN